MAQNNVTPLHANRKFLKAVNLNYVMNLRSRMTLQQVCNQLNAEGFTTASGPPAALVLIIHMKKGNSERLKRQPSGWRLVSHLSR